MGHRLPSKDEDGLLDVMGYPESMVLPDLLSQPVIEAKVFVNQIASHFFPPGSLFGLACGNTNAVPECRCKDESC